jgi:hypothetical protein
VTNTTPEDTVSKLTPTAAKVASVVLGTGEPPPSVTFRPVVGVETVTVVPAAIGLNRPTDAFGPGKEKVLASATIKGNAIDAPAQYQI